MTAREVVEKVAAATLAGAAAPALVVSAVSAAGFGTTGVLAGSTAAGWMAAGGGATPVLVSVCQAIGATGLLAAGAGALATVAVGGAAAGVTYLLVPAGAVRAVEHGSVAALRAVGGGLLATGRYLGGMTMYGVQAVSRAAWPAVKL